MCGRSRCRYNSKVTRAALELELYFILIQGGLPMTFPEIVKTTLWDIIDEMSRSLSSFVKNPDKDFIRKRKLDFKKMMHLIISMESGSLNHELLKFFEYDSSLLPALLFINNVPNFPFLHSVTFLRNLTLNSP
mgnify:CR=1 FL=1